MAMISMLEFINTAVMNSNRKDANAATWVYFDEIYLLLRDEESSKVSVPELEAIPQI